MRFILLLLVIISISGFSQNDSKASFKSFKIKQQVCLKKSGYQLVLKEVLSDSRCPKGLTCIWAGMVKASISVYDDGQFVEQKTLDFSEKLNDEDLQWLANYLPRKQKNIKKMTVLPYPKDGTTINQKKYFIKVEYLE